MNCPECGSETRTNELYCRVCGTEIRLTYDQVQDTLREEIQQDKETSTELTVRMLAMWLAFFMIVSVTLYNTSKDDLVSDEYPEKSYSIPVYSSRNDLVRAEPFEDIAVDTFEEVSALIEENKKGHRKFNNQPEKKDK